jgi:magnesium chelatase subunit I
LELPRTLGLLRKSSFSEAKLGSRTVKDELRQNLICKIQRGESLFPGILGYEDTVVPQVVNAVLSRHHFILLGLRGQAKTRLIRLLTTLLDEATPYLEGCEIHDNPYRPICRRCRDLVAEAGADAPIAWLDREHRYVEKLATPDVTIADMIGDIDPIKAARRGQDISDELTVHYGLLPRANRGIFAINELPDLAGKIQVGLFNIMQEGDVQIKGYPVRLPLDLMLVFTANPEDYTARGKIITPLKDRIGSEIRTHYPAELEQGIAINRRPGWSGPRRWKCAFRITSSRWWSNWRSWRERTSVSTSVRGCRNACRFRRWKTRCRTPSGAPSRPKKTRPCRASWICTRRCPPSRASWNWNTRAS